MTGTGKIAVALAAFLGLSLLSPYMVQANDQPPPDRDPAAMYKMVGANDGQLNQIRTLSKQFEDDSKARAQKMMAAMREMRKLTLQPDPDSPTVLAKQDEISKIQNEQSKAKITLILKIRGILNKDQKQKLVDMLQHNGMSVQPVGPGKASAPPIQIQAPATAPIKK